MSFARTSLFDVHHHTSSSAVATPSISLAISSTQVEFNSNIRQWSQLEHVDLIHRQGLNAPPCIFEFAEATESEDITNDRGFYRLLLPQTSASQHESVLCCRRKHQENKFRFSLNAAKLTKKDNPDYIGKMTCNDTLDSFAITLAAGIAVAEISIHEKRVTCELLNQYLNFQESGRDGRTIQGLTQTYMQPLLAMSVQASGRSVLRVHTPLDSAQQHGTEMRKFVVEFDYPLNAFLAFAIVCAVQARRLAAET